MPWIKIPSLTALPHRPSNPRKSPLLPTNLPLLRPYIHHHRTPQDLERSLLLFVVPSSPRSNHRSNNSVQASSTPTDPSPSNASPDPSHLSSSRYPRPSSSHSCTLSGKQSSNIGLKSPRYASTSIYTCYDNTSPTRSNICNSTHGMRS